MHDAVGYYIFTYEVYQEDVYISSTINTTPSRPTLQQIVSRLTYHMKQTRVAKFAEMHPISQPAPTATDTTIILSRYNLRRIPYQTAIRSTRV